MGIDRRTRVLKVMETKEDAGAEQYLTYTKLPYLVLGHMDMIFAGIRGEFISASYYFEEAT